MGDERNKGGDQFEADTVFTASALITIKSNATTNNFNLCSYSRENMTLL